ncbi:hypothetical protein WJX79_000245 [Trebouxia sp. C0005]
MLLKWARILPMQSVGCFWQQGQSGQAFSLGCEQEPIVTVVLHWAETKFRAFCLDSNSKHWWFSCLRQDVCRSSRQSGAFLGICAADLAYPSLTLQDVANTATSTLSAVKALQSKIGQANGPCDN